MLNNILEKKFCKKKYIFLTIKKLQYLKIIKLISLNKIKAQIAKKDEI